MRFALFGSSPRSTHGVDVTDTIERGVASLRKHRAYLDAIASPDADPDADPAAFVRDWATAAGPRLDVGAAATFELIPLG